MFKKYLNCIWNTIAWKGRLQTILRNCSIISLYLYPKRSSLYLLFCYLYLQSTYTEMGADAISLQPIRMIVCLLAVKCSSQNLYLCKLFSNKNYMNNYFIKKKPTPMSYREKTKLGEYYIESQIDISHT